MAVMADQGSEKVVACGPSPASADVPPFTRFLSGDTPAKIRDPKLCFKPREEWPAKTRISKARASDDQWFAICLQAHRRGVMMPVPPRDIFRGVDGEMVLSGAGGIP